MILMNSPQIEIICNVSSSEREYFTCQNLFSDLSKMEENNNPKNLREIVLGTLLSSRVDLYWEHCCVRRETCICIREFLNR